MNNESKAGGDCHRLFSMGKYTYLSDKREYTEEDQRRIHRRWSFEVMYMCCCISIRIGSK